MIQTYNTYHRFFLFALVALLTISCASYKIKKNMRAGHPSYGDYFLAFTPFERYGNWIVVKVSINGSEPLRMLFDTGAPNVIIPEVAKRLGLKTFAKGKVGDSGKNVQTLEYVQLGEVQVGEASFKDVTAVVAPLDVVPDIACAEFDGFIGANLMKLAIWEIDLRDSLISIHGRDNSEELDTTGYKIPFVRTSLEASPYIELTLWDSIPKVFKVDTGKYGSLDLQSNSFQQLYGDPEQYNYYKLFGEVSGGLYGMVKDTAIGVLVDSLNIGGLHRYHENLRVESKATNLLGMGILQDYRFILNWEDRYIMLFPYPDVVQDTTPTYQHLGFGVNYINQGLEITRLFENADAIRQGIRIGDQITAINDVQYDTPTLEDYCKIDRLLDTVEQVDLVIERDSITLEVQVKKTDILQRKE